MFLEKTFYSINVQNDAADSSSYNTNFSCAHLSVWSWIFPAFMTPETCFDEHGEHVILSTSYTEADDVIRNYTCINMMEWNGWRKNWTFSALTPFFRF